MNHFGSFEPGTRDTPSQSPAILVVAGARRFRALPTLSAELNSLPSNHWSASPPGRKSARPKVRQSASPPGRQAARPPGRQSESPKVRKSESPKVRKSESPKVRKSESPKVRQSARPKVRQSESPSLRRSIHPQSRNLRPLPHQLQRPTRRSGVGFAANLHDGFGLRLDFNGQHRARRKVVHPAMSQ